MKIINFVFIIVTFFILMDCNKSSDPLDLPFECNSENNPINFTFKYGVAVKNILNTSECTFQKDLVLDPPIVTNLKLTVEELDSVFALMQRIDFFDYPDTFYTNAQSDTIAVITPSAKYYYHVEIASLCKELYWNDSILYPDTLAEKLRNLNHLIINIIQSKKAYQNLPAARGGYD